MAAPIVGVSPAAVNLNPGGFVDVLVTASDPDSASGTSSFDVSDSQGNTTPVVVNVIVDDPLTFDPVAVVTGVAVTVSQIAVTATTATYRIQA